MKERYLLYMNFDGFADYYYTGSENRFPSLTSFIKESVRFTSCYSSIPSITVPMQCAIVTGTTSAKTHNCFKYYDRSSREVVFCKRRDDAETVAESFARNGKTVLSIQQFAVENHGCSRTDEDHLYIQPEKDFAHRFDILIDYFKNCRVPGFEFSSYRDAVLFYIDDLDSDGHNHHAPFAHTEAERVEKVQRKLELIDKRLGELIELLKELGLYEKTTILLTADHGMVGFNTPSYKERLIRDLSDITGLKVTADVEKASENDFLIIGDTIQAQVYFMTEKAREAKLKAQVEALHYVEAVLTRAELDEIGIASEYADLLISPKAGVCFFAPDNLPRDVRFASHDSLSDEAQHVFALVHDPNVEPKVINEKICIIDLIPSCLSLLGYPKLKDATGETRL